MNAKAPSLVAIVGPTAVGKTELAIALAEQLETEIISADSRLIYRGMDIGTAKPTAAQLARVRHHLIDVAEPEEIWSLARFKQAADVAIRQVQASKKLPLLVGGSGQYVTAILEGWLPPPKAPDHSIRDRYQRIAAEQGHVALHAQLEAVDPAGAQAIDPANVRRVVRALEIFELTGVPPSRQRVARPPSYRILRVGLSMNRSELYARIDERIERMLSGGLVEEVRILLDRGIKLDHPPMSGIGYRQIGEYLLGERSLDEATAEMRRLTRLFVRRQANWFKTDDPSIEWHDVSRELPGRLIERIVAWNRAD